MSAVPLTAREVSERMSFREFQRICLYFDQKLREKAAKAPRAMRFKHGNGFEEQMVSPEWIGAKFDVLSVERTPSLCDRHLPRRIGRGSEAILEREGAQHTVRALQIVSATLRILSALVAVAVCAVIALCVLGILALAHLLDHV